MKGWPRDPYWERVAVLGRNERHNVSASIRLAVEMSAVGPELVMLVGDERVILARESGYDARQLLSCVEEGLAKLAEARKPKP